MKWKIQKENEAESNYTSKKFKFVFACVDVTLNRTTESFSPQYFIKFAHSCVCRDIFEERRAQ